MNLLQHLLVKLSEECSEVIKEAMKMVLFGPGDHNPDDPNKIPNLERIYKELDDLQATIQMLNDTGFGYEPNERNILDKKVKVIKYLEYSITRGMTEEEASYEYDACTNPNAGRGYQY